MPINLTVTQSAPIRLSYVEAAIKPEVAGHVTPTYEEQTVYPAAGTVFGSVEVDPIPDPTAIKEIDSNGDHDVRRHGTARVSVTPTLQSKTATPTEQAQTILPDTGYDGLESVDIGRIPTEYIVPTGTKNITKNGVESVREYDSVEVNVEPTLQGKTVTPTKQTQTVNADSGYDGLDTVEIKPIPSEYIVPQGKTTISQNGTVNVSQYAEAEVSVSSTPQPVLLETINIGALPEQVNRITIDATKYDLSNRMMLYVVGEDVTFSVSDWLYVGDSSSSNRYLNASSKSWNFVKLFFANINGVWRGVLGTGTRTAFLIGGDTTPLGTLFLHAFTSSTKFISGVLKVYAV